MNPSRWPPWAVLAVIFVVALFTAALILWLIYGWALSVDNVGPQF